tara:strand:+ start:893 stop:1519 length:627 start_codon:yes stop_codon:yes gene_type:complete
MTLPHYLLLQFVLQKEIYTMSNKNLLNESTIRKFMKLASIEPLASDFLGRIQESEEKLDEAEEDLEEGRDKEELDEAEEDLEEGRDKEEVDEAAHAEDEKVEEDVDLEERGDMMFKDDEDLDMDAEAGGKMVDVDAFIAALESALEDTMGEPAEVEYEEEPEEADMDMDIPDAGEELALDADSEEEEEEEDLAESIYKEVLKKLSKKK